MMDFWTLVFLVCVGIGIKRIIQAKKEAQLLEKNPEAWRALKGEQADERDRRRRNKTNAALKGAGLLTRIIFKK